MENEMSGACSSNLNMTVRTLFYSCNLKGRSLGDSMNEHVQYLNIGCEIVSDDVR